MPVRFWQGDADIIARELGPLLQRAEVRARELAKSEERYRAIVENAADPIFMTDPEGRLGGTADPRQPWPIRFWFGGWDGDLLVGYFRGNLGLPFTETT